jgi:GAF domain-containing protein
VQERTLEIQAANAELAVINRVQESLAAELDMQTIYDLVGDQIRDIFDAQVVIIVEYDPDLNLINFNYMIEKGERFYPEPRPIGLLAQQIIERRRPILLNTRESMVSLGMETIDGTEESKSSLSVPLIMGGEVKGGIGLQNIDREHAFSQSDVRLLSTLAKSMSVALENARLFKETNRLLAETEQRAAELAVINSVQEGLAAELDVQAIYNLVGDQIRDIFDAQTVIIVTYEHTAELVNFQYMIEKGERQINEPIPLNKLHRHIIKTRQPILINENAELTKEQFGMRTVGGGAATKSLLFVPMMVAGSVKGMVSLQNVDREHAFSDSDVRLLSTLANSMSVALENARLFDETNRLLAETEQRAAELSIINSVGEAMAKQLDVDTVSRLVGDKVRDIFNAEAVLIMLHDRESDMLVFRYAYDKAEGGHVEANSFPYGAGVTSKIIQSRQPLIYGTDQEGVEMGAIPVQFKDKDPDEQGTESFMGVPIIIGEKVLGVISVQSHLQHAYQADDVRLLSTLAANMGVAIENARLFEETNRLLAETEQRAAELSIINSVGEAMAKQLDVDTVTQLVGDKVADIFNAEAMHIILHDQESDMLVFRYGFDKSDLGHREAKPFPFGEGITTKIIQSRKPL